MLLHSMLSCNSAIDLQLLSWLILNDFPFSVSFDSALSRCNNKHKVLGNCDHFVSYGAFHTWALINPQHFTQTAQCIFLALNNHNGPILAKNCSTLTTSIAEVETRKSDCGIIYQGSLITIVNCQSSFSQLQKRLPTPRVEEGGVSCHHVAAKVPHDSSAAQRSTAARRTTFGASVFCSAHCEHHCCWHC